MMLKPLQESIPPSAANPTSDDEQQLLPYDMIHLVYLHDVINMARSLKEILISHGTMTTT